MGIKKVWIEEGCISCELCTSIAPDVFLVENGLDCVVRPDAGRHFGPRAEEIREAAEDCPVEVIHVEEAAADQPAAGTGDASRTA